MEEALFNMKCELAWLRLHPEAIFNFGSEEDINQRAAYLIEQIGAMTLDATLREQTDMSHDSAA